MQLSFIIKLGLHIQKTDISAQKIDNNKLKTFGMIIASFLINDKDEKSCFFEKTFLLVNNRMNITFEILFFILNNGWINFNNLELK